SSRRRHTRSTRDWSSDVCSSDLFLGACQHELELELTRQAQRRRDVAPPVRVSDERLLRVQHGQQRLKVAGRRRQRLHLGATEVRSEERRVGKEGECRLLRQEKKE